jgi:hypothetical protein
MPRVAIRRAQPGHKALEVEIACLRGLDLKALRARWRTVFRKEAPPHLSRHLIFRVLVYRLQADSFGDLDSECQRLLKQSDAIGTAGKIEAHKGALQSTTIAQGTILTREWNGRIYRVAVLADGFACNGKTYQSLSKVASAITGTRWNGPRFFGLRDKITSTKSGAT